MHDWASATIADVVEGALKQLDVAPALCIAGIDEHPLFADSDDVSIGPRPREKTWVQASHNHYSLREALHIWK